MKKILGVSFAAMLAVSPMMAMADDLSSITLLGNPAGTVASESNIATTSYVKGAYNDLAGKINTDRGAINTLNGNVETAGSVLKSIKDNAAGATYSNTESGLTATTVQGAIDEISGTAANAANKDLSNLSATGTGVITTAVTNNAASGTYSNTTSGLTATTLQGAIDEVAGTAGNAANKDLSNLSATGTGVITTAITNNAAGATYSNTTSGLTATTLQAAIDEVEGRVDTAETKANNAADKDLSNLSATGTGVITTAITNNAAGATYSNTTSGLTATTLQAAIDEVAGTAATANSKDSVVVYSNWNGGGTPTGPVKVSVITSAAADAIVNPTPAP